MITPSLFCQHESTNQKRTSVKEERFWQQKLQELGAETHIKARMISLDRATTHSRHLVEGSK